MHTSLKAATVNPCHPIEWNLHRINIELGLTDPYNIRTRINIESGLTEHLIQVWKNQHHFNSRLYIELGFTDPHQTQD